jgi:ATP/maltotriose-dependent transcriptional regulator MalT
MDAVQQGEAAARGKQLARTAHCLLLIEREIERTPTMLSEAAALLPSHYLDFDWRWADALLGQFRDEPDAVARLESALAIARRSEDHVAECECLVRLVQLALDRGELSCALASCRELAPVAAKMTDSSEGAIADALEALARLASGVHGADAHLERALASLRDVDAKGMLAYVLAAAADLDRTAGRTALAEQRAAEALAAAQAVQRRSLVASARASLAELALARDDRAQAALHFDAVAADVGSPLAVSERVRARLARIASAVGR